MVANSPTPTGVLLGTTIPCSVSFLMVTLVVSPLTGVISSFHLIPSMGEFSKTLIGDVINGKSLYDLSTEASTSTEDLAGTEMEYTVYRKRKGGN